jgi:hypothetical protein
MYLRSELIKKLIELIDVKSADEYVAAGNAVDKFLEKVRNDQYAPSVILMDEGYDIAIEGDLEEDAEHVCSTQEYWTFEFYTGGTPNADYVPLRRTETVELPNEDKLLDEDGER